MSDKKNINIEIGARIKFHRERVSLTQESFAELIGLGAKTVSAIEQGAVGISVDTLIKICTTLFVTSDELLFGNCDKSQTTLIATRLERLTPKQLEIAGDILAKFAEGLDLK